MKNETKKKDIYDPTCERRSWCGFLIMNPSHQMRAFCIKRFNTRNLLPTRRLFFNTRIKPFTPKQNVQPKPFTAKKMHKKKACAFDTKKHINTTNLLPQEAFSSENTIYTAAPKTCLNQEFSLLSNTLARSDFDMIMRTWPSYMTRTWPGHCWDMTEAAGTWWGHERNTTWTSPQQHQDRVIPR